LTHKLKDDGGEKKMSEQMGIFFIGLAGLCLALTICYFLMNLVKSMRFEVERDNRYRVLEIALLNKIAAKRNIDLDKEAAKLELVKKNKFSKAIEQEILAEFGVKEDGRKRN